MQIFCLIQLSDARVTVFNANINGSLSEYYPTPEMAYGIRSFSIKAQVVEVLDPADGCTHIKDDIKGKIAIIQYDGDMCYPDIIMQNVIDAGGSVSRLRIAV